MLPFKRPIPIDELSVLQYCRSGGAISLKLKLNACKLWLRRGWSGLCGGRSQFMLAGGRHEGDRGSEWHNGGRISADPVGQAGEGRAVGRRGSRTQVEAGQARQAGVDGSWASMARTWMLGLALRARRLPGDRHAVCTLVLYEGTSPNTDETTHYTSNSSTTLLGEGGAGSNCMYT